MLMRFNIPFGAFFAVPFLQFFLLCKKIEHVEILKSNVII